MYDIYALYVRAHRNYSLSWVGPEPEDAAGQLAIAIGKSDGRLGGNPIKTRDELMRAIAEYNDPKDPAPVGSGWGAELRIQSDKWIKLSYGGMVVPCAPRTHLGSILEYDRTTGGWYWCCYRQKKSSGRFRSIDDALTDFCKNAFEEPIKL